MLKKLEVLNVNQNRLSGLPEAFAKLTNLKEVLLSNNNFVFFPTELVSLQNVNLVDLSKNKISALPDSVSNIQAIELNLNQNQVNSASDIIISILLVYWSEVACIDPHIVFAR